jgi:hypothetical protein
MEEIKESDFFIELIKEQSLVITIPVVFSLSDLEDMKMKGGYFYFKFNKEKCKSLNLKEVSKITIENDLENFISSYNKNKSNKNIYIIDIKELKRQTKGIFYIYE